MNILIRKILNIVILLRINNQKSMIKCVNLAYCKISRLGSLDFFNTSFPFMNELDIESNLLDSWSTIFQLLGQLKQIKILNIRF